LSFTTWLFKQRYLANVRGWIIC